MTVWLVTTIDDYGHEDTSSVHATEAGADSARDEILAEGSAISDTGKAFDLDPDDEDDQERVSVNEWTVQA